MKLTEAVKWLWSDDTLSARRARWVLKIVLVLLLLIALFWVVDFGEVIHALATADPLFLIIGFALTFLRVFLSAVQLMILVRKQGINLGVGQIIYINLSVKFYLLFLPGDLVGSGIRWYKLSQPSGKRAEALAAVAFNRLFDLFLIFVLGLGFWLLSSQDYVQIDGRQLVVLIFLIILLWFILTRLSLPLSKIIASRAGGTYSSSFFQSGMQKLAVGRARIHADITGEEQLVCFAVLHLGDHNLIGGVREYMGDEFFSRMRQEITDAFMKSDIPKMIRLMDRHFETHSYSLWHLFKDEQRKVLNQIIEPTLSEIADSFRQTYEQHYPIMQVMRDLQIPIPKALAATAEFILNTDLRKSLETKELDLEHLQKLVEEAKKWSFELDMTTLGFVASQRINSLMEKLSMTPEDLPLLERIETMFRILSALPLELDLWKTQNICFSISRQLNGEMRESAERGDQTAKKWVEHFNNLQDHLYVRGV